MTFASVHDSYWTHACDIDVMSRFIRDTFVRLHSLDVLEKLEQEVGPATHLTPFPILIQYELTSSGNAMPTMSYQSTYSGTTISPGLPSAPT